MLFDLLRTGGAPGRLKRLRLLRRFRQLREHIAATAPKDFDGPLFARLVADTGTSEAQLRQLVAEWMEERPLRHLRAARVPGVMELFDQLRARGIQVTIWSDYPVRRKLAALGLTADDHVCATDHDLNCLKPDPTGLLRAMERASVNPADTLMVGDRLTHDGTAAAAAGVDFLLISERPPARLNAGQYHARDYTALASANRMAAT